MANAFKYSLIMRKTLHKINLQKGINRFFHRSILTSRNNNFQIIFEVDHRSATKHLWPYFWLISLNRFLKAFQPLPHLSLHLCARILYSWLSKKVRTFSCLTSGFRSSYMREKMSGNKWIYHQSWVASERRIISISSIQLCSAKHQKRTL